MSRDLVAFRVTLRRGGADVYRTVFLARTYAQAARAAERWLERGERSAWIVSTVERIEEPDHAET